MESDSDSDGSHISATPPRRPKPPSPPSIIPSSSISNIHRTRSRASFPSRSKSISKPPKSSYRPAKPSPKPDVEPIDSNSEPLPASTLPYLIRRLSDPNLAVSTVGSIENLPAGYFSKYVSFSKIRRQCLNFEPVQDEPSPSSAPSQQDKTKIDCSPAHCVALGVKSEGISCGDSMRVVRKHSNLIGGNVSVPPVKFRKCGGEGNFVRLNLNGRKRKFVSKGSNKNSYKSNGHRFYRRGKSKLKAEAGTETTSICDEDGLVTVTTQQKQRQDSGEAKIDCKAIEEAVLLVRKEPSDENLMKLLKLTYGYDSFRDGQLEAVKMVLAGESTMLVLPTGAGKSLCYQLPAMILPGITLVVSPLIALMFDQLKQLPQMIQGGLLCSSQKPEEVSETLRMLHQGTIKVLLVSPERFLNAEFLSIFSASVAISLVVVDEAHCISEWSHNFRPSYMRLRASLLHAQLNVKCVLAMTATATTATLHAVMTALEIHPNNLILKPTLRENLQMTVSSSRNRVKDLLALIKSPPFSEVQSIIIYCKFQSETDIISRWLCDNNISAKSYHSGLPAKDRCRIQDSFCSNKIRVVVATVAFGMGLDKRDVGAVIHYSLPESLEEYVQEMGRAGRDGRLSYCHLFFDDDTFFKLRSLMHSDGVDEYAVNKFLCQVFYDKCIRGRMCSLVKESASHKLDMKEQVMLTLLTQLELGEVQYLRLLPQSNVTCTLNFHKTSPLLLGEKDIIVAEILKKSETKQGQYVFDIPAVVNSIGITAIDLSTHLQNLRVKGEITYEVKDLAFCYTIIEVPGDFCSLSAHLTRWLSEIETCKVRKLDAMYNTVVSALNMCEKENGCCGNQHTPCLQRKILNYFNEDSDFHIHNKISQSSPFLRADIKVFLQNNSQVKFTPRAVARIMHGIASPAYPSATWSKTHFWGRYTQIDFQAVMEAAKAELINVVRKDVI